MHWHFVFHLISWGGPTRWIRQLYCIDGRYFDKPAIRDKLDSGEWPTPLTDRMRDRCAEVAQYNIASLSEDDIIDQKNLWIKMLEEPTAYSTKEFALGLNHSSLTVKGATPYCMRYLRDVSNKVTAESGIWRLWSQPKDVPRAEIVAKMELNVDPEDAKRIRHNIDNTLEERVDGEPNPLDEPLSPPRNLPRAKGGGKGEKELKEAERKRLEEARNKRGPPIGSGEASSSNRLPSPERQGHKKSAGDPASPDSIDRHARSHWASYGSKMKMHYAGDYPRSFRRVKGTMHLILDNFMEGLTINPEEYSPIMQTLRNGDLKYEMVTPYNQKWLPRDAHHKPIPEDRRVSFDPATVWVEDRWILCRRMT